MPGSRSARNPWTQWSLLSSLSPGGFELADAFQGFCSQCRGILRDRELTAALDVGYAPVERRHQFSQVTECARSVSTNGFLVRHRTSVLYTDGDVEIAMGRSWRGTLSAPPHGNPL